MNFLDKMNEFVNWLPKCTTDSEFNFACMQLQGYFRLSKDLLVQPAELEALQSLFNDVLDKYKNKSLAKNNMNIIIAQVNERMQKQYHRLGVFKTKQQFLSFL